MFWELLLTLSVAACENKFLTVNSKYRGSKAPLELKSDFLSSEAKDEANHRSKRYYFDDHNSDWADKIKINKTTLNQDNHGTAYVEWGGTDKGSDTIVVLTRVSANPPTESNLYVSIDYGKSFTQRSVTVDGLDTVCSYIYHSPVDHRKFMLNDVVHNAVVVSTDEGRNWNARKTSFTPSYIEHHPTLDDRTLAYDSLTSKLWLSRNFGESWETILPNKNVKDMYWGATDFDVDNTLFVTTTKDNGNIDIFKSSDFFVNQQQLIDSDVIEFALVNEFYFSIKKSTHTNHGTNDRDLFISYDRDPLVKVQFPPFVDKNPTTEFYIADADLGQAFVAVSHQDNVTHLYVTEHKGVNMILSLERVLFTNQASYDRITWLSGIEPFVDFQKIEGMPGVFIASQLDTGSVGHRRIHTVMTYNKGGSWQRVQPPQYDYYGEPTECYLPECSLHISLMFGIRYPYAKHTPLLSKENAPGYILASGNIGSAHSTLNDVFMSNDGGVEWFQVLEGQYNFQFADHGGIAVAADRSPTTVIMYSHDEGVTWYNKTISSLPLNIYGLITEPGETSSVFNVYATYPTRMEWIIITIDFKEFLGPPCGSDDFALWSIRDELKNTECVLGTDTKYERKKPTSHCYIGTDYQRTVNPTPCPCQASDFECDFLYMRENAGDPCIIADGVQEIWFIPDHCPPGEFYNKSMGYYKIEGDKCVGGEENIFSYTRAPCPDKGIANLSISMSPGHAIELGQAITLSAHTTSYIEDTYFMWHFSNNFTKSGTGSQGTQVIYTFDKEDTYTITLTASNGAGPVVSMATVDVDTRITGLEIKFSPEDPAVDEGMIFIVTNANGLHLGRLGYEWSTGSYSNLPLLMYSFGQPGRQTITCSVSNSLGTQQLSVSFVVSDLSITSLGAIAVDSTSIQVFWLPPSMRPGLVSAYTLKYMASTDDTWSQIALPVNSTHYRASNLNAGATYKFLVVTSSPGGHVSEESDTVTATTLQLNARDAAQNVRATSKGSQATVTWQAPSSSGDSPNSYNVEYWMSDRPNTVKSKAPSQNSDMTVTLTDLTAGAVYTVRVVALYPNGIKSYANVIDTQIEGITPEEIKNIRGFPVNDTALVIVWDPPANQVDGYHIYNATSSSIITTVATSQVTIRHLRPYTTYMFNVEPYAGSRKGSKSDIVSVRTDTGTPGSVKDLSCTMKDGVAQLRWHEPDTPNGPINKYLIGYVDDRLSDLDIPSYVSKDKLTLSLPNLPEYQQFKFSVSVQGPEATSPEAYTTCKITSGTGMPGPPTDLYVKGVDISSIDIMWRAPVIADTSDVGYEVKYGAYSKGTWIGLQHVQKTDQLYMTLSGADISPSTEYGITVAAYNAKGTGQPSQTLIAATLTPDIGSVEYEIKFAAGDVSTSMADLNDFANAIKEEIVSVTGVSRSRLAGFRVSHQDKNDVKVSIWISPRDTASDPDAPATETVVSKLDSAINDKKFIVGSAKAHGGQVEQTQAQTGSHHDVAEIVIPGICGLMIVGLVAGLLYYRNQCQKLLRRNRFTSRYTNNDNDDVNMIECAEEPEGISSDDLRRGELSITNDTSHQPSSMRNFFKRFNYTPVDQDDPDELEDDEEHLLPL